MNESNVNTGSIYGNIVLCSAILIKSEKLVKMLIDKGANLEPAYELLILSVKRRSIETVKILEFIKVYNHEEFLNLTSIAKRKIFLPIFLAEQPTAYIPPYL